MVIFVGIANATGTACYSSWKP